MPQHTKTIKRE